MPRVIIILLMSISLKSQAQFFYSPFPPTKNDYLILEKSEAKIGYEYEIENANKILISVMEFGNKGLPAAWYEKGINVDGDSATMRETIYKYHPLLKLSSSTFTNFDEEEKSITAYTYDTKGRLIQKIFATIDPITYKYKYDAAGRIVSESSTIKMPVYDKDGDPTGKSFDKPTAKSIFKYDTKNRLSEEWFYYADMGTIDDSQPVFKRRWEYNSKNQLVKLTNIDADGETTRVLEFKYNEKGLLIKKTVQTFNDEETKEFIYEYCTDCKQSWMQ
jgi:YD repeat-containing protein